MARYIELAPQLVRLYRLNLHCKEVIKEFLLTAVTADVRENVHARWKVRQRTDKWEYCECQNCGECYDFDIGERFRYCPNCGAEMNERRDDEESTKRTD